MANDTGGLRGLVAILLLVMFIATCGSARDPVKYSLANQNEGSKRKPSNSNPPPKPSPKPKMRSKPKTTPNPEPTPSPTPAPPAIKRGSTFSVLDYGAKGDGATEDTEAFLDAWGAACHHEAPSAMLVPSNREFLVGPISFSGPCEPNIVFQLDGTIIAPTSAKAWGTGRLQWLEFRVLEQVKIQGRGTIEGRGSVWWSNTQYLLSNSLDTKLSGNLPHTRPTALRFYGSSKVTVTGITIQNSQQCHLKFDSCQAVEVSGVTISSPGDSPNTDGIHLQNSVGVTIRSTDMACGDDCISIQTGCSNIQIQNVKCGPGHGISIGGLGKGNTQAAVSDVTVQNADLVGTLTGVRIKTWQGGSGYAKGFRFSNIKVSQVMTPIVIDQFYCEQTKCKNQTSAVALSDITYDGVVGTYTVQPVRLACSDSKPCSGIHLSGIQLQGAQQRGKVLDPFCWKAFGDIKGPTEPPIHCLQ
ncbi:polygalacturonase At1g48100-like [Zingiber officinale]|uniref:polygalacturonase At1g48100-like n=1 Tax=Zingiber officinale TaxID=94328 RepID=UPI001C4BA7AA|nr:polygalacturonase At1g48100-like [Zingiber officinale]